MASQDSSQIIIKGANGRELVLKLQGGITKVNEKTLCEGLGYKDGSLSLEDVVEERGEDRVSILLDKCESSNGSTFDLSFVIGKNVRATGIPKDQQIKEENIITLDSDSECEAIPPSSHSVKPKTSENFCTSDSVLDLIKALPLKSRLRECFAKVQRCVLVAALPQVYDGDILFELPPVDSGNNMMEGMQPSKDSHYWEPYVTTHTQFPGTVRKASCTGHFQCPSNQCPYYIRSGERNENQWLRDLRGKHFERKGVFCVHCKGIAMKINACFATVYYCIPKIEGKVYTRCVIHLGMHDHPLGSVTNRESNTEVRRIVLEKAHQDPSLGGPRSLQQSVMKDIIMQTLVSTDLEETTNISDEKLNQLFKSIEPLNDKKRVGRWMQEERAMHRLGSDDYSSILELKKRSMYEYIHSVLFPGQLDDNNKAQCHVFKMSTMGPGSGVDLVNRMQPGGNLEKFWVCVDHCHRIDGWVTMGAHVYDPFVQELVTIAVCDFKVEDTMAQISFWEMLNAVMAKKGFDKPMFRGFMADEAQANWKAIRTVFNGSSNIINAEKERSCIFHWEQSMIQHTRSCIKPCFQEEHKKKCRQWKNAHSREVANTEFKRLQSWWSNDHAIDSEIPRLQTWLAWWNARISHWGEFMVKGVDDRYGIPTTNLAESIHGSWLAAENQKKKIGLYAACVTDMATSLLQSSRYNSFLSGQYLGQGPRLEDLRRRVLQEHKEPSTPKNVARETDVAAKEVGGTMKRKSLHGDVKTIRKKRGASSNKLVGEEDSHRPEYVYVTRRAGKSILNIMEIEGFTVQEIEINDVHWAIRRTKMNSKVRCNGFLQETKNKCNKLISSTGVDKSEGVAAPCFKARRNTPVGVKECDFWFCADDVRHSWSPMKMIIGVPGPAPGEWNVAKGTSLRETEVEALTKAGFVLKGIGSTKGQAGSSRHVEEQDGDSEGIVMQLSSKHQSRIAAARQMEVVVEKEEKFKNGKGVTYTITTTTSIARNKSHTVVISRFPSCSCEDFLARVSRREKYMACKHIYYALIYKLQANLNENPYIHKTGIPLHELLKLMQNVH